MIYIIKIDKCNQFKKNLMIKFLKWKMKLINKKSKYNLKTKKLNNLSNKTNNYKIKIKK